MSYVAPNPDARVIGADGRLRYRYGVEVREALATARGARGAAASRPAPAFVWSSLPMPARHFFCTQALGMRGESVCALAWDEIEPRERVAIGAKARELLGVLV